MNALTFQNTTFDVVTQNGQPWLRAAQIANALGYSREDAISRIYDRNKSEFSEAMAQTVKLTVSGLQREIRIFSLRGAHLLAMLARTAVAKAFRVWVLDVLDEEVDKLRQMAAKALPNGLTPAQQRQLQEFVAKKAMSLPKARQRAAYPALWGGIKSHFQVGTYKDLSPSQFAAALSFVESYEWELVEDAPVVKESYHFPLEAASPHDRVCGSAHLTPRVLVDPKNRALELEAVEQLEKNGHDVKGLKVRILALRDAAARSEELRTECAAMANQFGAMAERMRTLSSQYGRNVLFARSPNLHDPIERNVYRDQVGRK